MTSEPDGNYILAAFGLRVGVLRLDPDELEALRQRFPQTWEFRPVAPPLPRVSRWFAAVSPARGASRATFDRRIEGLGNRIQAFISEYAKTHILVHAGVVAFGGHAVLLPGRSGSGKSTLVDRLVREGATYLSDEYAAIDPSGLIHPYARPIALRSSNRGSKVRRPAPKAGGVIATAPLPAGLILETEYRPGVRFRPRPLSQLEMVGALSRNSAASRHRPEAALQAFTRLTAAARGFEGPRGGPDAVVRWLAATMPGPRNRAAIGARELR